MHPWVVLPSPEGGCPICGMDLVPLDTAEFAGELTIDPVMVQNIGVRIGDRDRRGRSCARCGRSAASRSTRRAWPT